MKSLLCWPGGNIHQSKYNWPLKDWQQNQKNSIGTTRAPKSPNWSTISKIENYKITMSMALYRQPCAFVVILTWAAELWLVSDTDCGNAQPSGSPDSGHAGKSCPCVYKPLENKHSKIYMSHYKIQVLTSICKIVVLKRFQLFTHSGVSKT